MENGKGRIVFMPDIEYKAWCNKNEKLIDEIIKTGKINTLWLRKNNNRDFLVRRLGELGYRINFD